MLTATDPNQDVRPIEHPAHLGASSAYDDVEGKLTSEQITERIKGGLLRSCFPPKDALTDHHGRLSVIANANNGVGMDEGLRSKAIAQQERVAERSRLRAEGLLESHVTHEKLTSFSPEHREVADGARLMEQHHGNAAA